MFAGQPVRVAAAHPKEEMARRRSSCNDAGTRGGRQRNVFVAPPAFITRVGRWLTRVGDLILLVVRRLDSSIDARIGVEEVLEVCAVEQLYRFALGELVGCFAVLACRDEYALRCALVLECAVEVADGRDTDGVFVAFGLNNDFAAQNRIGVIGDAVDAAIRDPTAQRSASMRCSNRGGTFLLKE